jgi:hypothetical protein
MWKFGILQFLAAVRTPLTRGLVEIMRFHGDLMKLSIFAVSHLHLVQHLAHMQQPSTFKSNPQKLGL